MGKRKNGKGNANHGDRVYDMRHLYGRLPTNAHIVATTIDEPNGLLSRDTAELEAAQHRDGTRGEGAPEWVPPSPPQTVVAQSIRNDPLGQMYARHQVDRPEYLAARNYQELHATAQIGNIGAMNPCKPYVDGGTFSEFMTEKQRLAAKRLRAVDQVVVATFGSTGLVLVQAVLIDKMTIAEVAGPAREHRAFAGSLFGNCLIEIAYQLGYATRSRVTNPVGAW
jgi:hypothetical protein